MFSKTLEHTTTIVILSLVVACVAIVSGYYILRPETQNLAASPATIMSLQESVTADGSIDSDQNVSLSFENNGMAGESGGTVAAVNVAVGDYANKGEVLASLDESNLNAQLGGAEADVTAVEANLESLEKGATPQTLAVSKEGVSTAEAALTTALEDAYLKASDAVLNKSDTLFQNGMSSNPIILIPTDSYPIGIGLNNQRADITSEFNKLKNDLSANTATSGSLISESSTTLSSIKSFLDMLSTETGRLTSANSGFSPAQISAYVSAVNAAETELNAATAEFNSAIQAYKTSTDELAVVTASSTSEDIQAAEAQVGKAQAAVASIKSQIADGIITAPFDGVVASVNLKVGEAYTAATPAITLISAGNYKIDLMIPQNEVASIRVGEPATLSFPSNADLSATATIASIDLAPTVVDGVSAYKSTLYLSGTNPDIRIGMTANVTIPGETRENVLAVPSSSVITESDGTFVLVKGSNGLYTKQKVEIGISDGTNTEIRSGLSAGALVATFGD